MMNLKGVAKLFYSDEEESENYGAPRMVNSGRLDIIARSPREFRDAREYADALAAGSALMVSFDHVDGMLRNRIFDYLNGVSYVIGARVARINDNLLMYTPAEVQVEKESTKKSRSWLSI
jgi:FtsZ-interacting cell division protein YlmF